LTNIKLHASHHREANSRKIPICDIIWEKVVLSVPFVCADVGLRVHVEWHSQRSSLWYISQFLL